MKWLTVIAFLRKALYCSHYLLELSANSYLAAYYLSSKKNSESTFKSNAVFRVHDENKTLLPKVVMQ